MYLKMKLTDMVHEILSHKIKSGNIIVDATVGNGFDTVFLAKTVGENGQVIGFDIQEEAIKNTTERLSKEGLIDRVKLICDSHSNINQYLDQFIDGALFNLGYLPKGNEAIITKAETTLIALGEILQLLKHDGFVIIISYWGHEGGKDEKEAVENFLCKLNNKKYTTAQFNYLNRLGCPPVVYFIEKYK